MTTAKPRRRSIFSGLLLILLGALFLLANFREDLRVWELFARWWPLLLIIWGLAKLYDYLLARSTGEAAPRTITGGEIFLVLLLVLLAGGVAAGDWITSHPDANEFGWPPWEHAYSFNEEVPAKAVPADARINMHIDRGDIVVRAEDAAEIRVLAKKTLRGSDENQAQKRAQEISVVINETGDAYEVRTQHQGQHAPRAQVDLEAYVPKRASLTAETERGNFQATGLAGSVSVSARRGDIEIRETAGDVNVEVQHGDVHIVGAGGNVKLSGRGGQVEVAEIKGEAVVNGEFYGPVRMEKVAKGARFLSRRTDLTVTQSVGRIETGSGQLEITDASGNVSLVTRKYDIVLDNVRGRVEIENRDGDVELRFLEPPKEPVTVTNQSGNVEIVLPAKSSFEVQAESRSGEIDCEFEGCAHNKVEEHGNVRLNWTLGAKGPQLRLKTTYGDIRLRRVQ